MKINSVQILCCIAAVTVYLVSSTNNKGTINSGSEAAGSSQVASDPIFPVIPEEPLLSLVKPLIVQLSSLKTASPEKVKDIRAFYLVFSDMVKRDNGIVFSSSVRFRDYNKLCLGLAFKNTGNPVPETLSRVEQEIEKILLSSDGGGLSLIPDSKIDISKLSKTLEAISYAAHAAL